MRSSSTFPSGPVTVLAISPNSSCIACSFCSSVRCNSSPLLGSVAPVFGIAVLELSWFAGSGCDGAASTSCIGGSSDSSVLSAPGSPLVHYIRMIRTCKLSRSRLVHFFCFAQILLNPLRLLVHQTRLGGLPYQSGSSST